MPLYSYRCKKCGKVFEKLVRNTEPAPACPECQSADTERQYAGTRAFGCPGSSGGNGGSCGGDCSCCHGCH